MRKKLIVANWKMNFTVDEGLKFIEDLDKMVSASPKVEVVICPSSVALDPLAAKLKPMKFGLGAQNIYFADHGPYTGEVSAVQVRNLAEYVIVGHSERRLHFNETNDIVARKVSAALRNDLSPILCVGENLYERQDNETAVVVHDQLAAGLVMLTTREVAKVVIAYEPVWAVGTGEVAKPEQINTAIKILRKTIKDLYGETTANSVRVLYGGSVEPELAASYMKINGLDGFLVGGASLRLHDFATIIKAAQGSRAKAKA